jgi:hypothetical protein
LTEGEGLLFCTSMDASWKASTTNRTQTQKPPPHS